MSNYRLDLCCHQKVDSRQYLREGSALPRQIWVVRCEPPKTEKNNSSHLCSKVSKSFAEFRLLLFCFSVEDAHICTACLLSVMLGCHRSQRAP